LSGQFTRREFLKKAAALGGFYNAEYRPDGNMACRYCFYLRKSNLFQTRRIHRMSEGGLKKADPTPICR